MDKLKYKIESVMVNGKEYISKKDIINVLNIAKEFEYTIAKLLITIENAK